MNRLNFINELRLILAAGTLLAATAAHAVTVNVNGVDDEDFVFVTAQIDWSSLTAYGDLKSDNFMLSYVGSHWDVSAEMTFDSSLHHDSVPKGDVIGLFDVIFTHKKSHDPAEGIVSHTLGDADKLNADAVAANGSQNPSFNFPSAGTTDLHGQHVHQHSVHAYAEKLVLKDLDSPFTSAYFFDSDPVVTFFAVHPIPLPGTGMMLLTAVLGCVGLRLRKS